MCIIKRNSEKVKIKVKKNIKKKIEWSEIKVANHQAVTILLIYSLNLTTKKRF
jgi:hypothetical protein